MIITSYNGVYYILDGIFCKTSKRGGYIPTKIPEYQLSSLYKIGYQYIHISYFELYIKQIKKICSKK